MGAKRHREVEGGGAAEVGDDALRDRVLRGGTGEGTRVISACEMRPRKDGGRKEGKGGRWAKRGGKRVGEETGAARQHLENAFEPRRHVLARCSDEG